MKVLIMFFRIIFNLGITRYILSIEGETYLVKLKEIPSIVKFMGNTYKVMTVVHDIKDYYATDVYIFLSLIPKESGEKNDNIEIFNLTDEKTTK